MSLCPEILSSAAVVHPDAAEGCQSVPYTPSGAIPEGSNSLSKKVAWCAWAVFGLIASVAVGGTIGVFAGLYTLTILGDGCAAFVTVLSVYCIARSLATLWEKLAGKTIHAGFFCR
jgi:hypothetical protein